VIFGIGTDIVAVARMRELWQRHGERVLDKILAPDERAACLAATEPARFMAKRFAAKEALGKALGSGMRAPVLLPEISVIHDALGKPDFTYGAALTAHMQHNGLTARLSISDEQEYAVAFVVVECP
jgi:holo-[acyl-carrier protein] synthase